MIGLLRFTAVVLKLTQTLVQEVERHAVALLCTGDGDETLVAVVLRFINLDHTARDLPDLVDLLSTLADDSANHVVGDVDLLGKGSSYGRAMRASGMGSRAASMADMGRNVRGGGTVATGGVGTVMHRDGGVGLGRVRGTIWRRVLVGRHAATAVVGPGIGAVALVKVAVAKAAASGLGNVGDNLKSTGNRGSGASATGGISRGGGTTETLVQLLEKSATNVVSSNVDGIGNAHDNQ